MGIATVGASRFARRLGALTPPNDERGFMLGFHTVVGSTRSGGRATTAALGVSIANSSVVASPLVVENDDVTTTTITVTVLDAAGIAIAGAAVIIAASGTGNTFSATTGNTDSNGQVIVTLRSSVAEAKTITASANGTSLTPGAVTFAASDVPSATYSLIALSNAAVVSGATRTVTITAKTAADGAISVGGAVVVPTQSGPGTVTFGSVTDNMNGTYTCVATGVLAGACAIGATINGAAITSGDQTLTVSPGAYDPDTSTVSVSSTTGTIGGNDIGITVQLKDAAGNNLTTGGETVVVTNSGGTSTLTLSATTDNADGSYLVSATPTGAGTATALAATVGGQNITTTMPTITVSTAFAAPDLFGPTALTSTSFGGVTKNNGGTPTGVSLSNEHGYDPATGLDVAGGSIYAIKRVVPTTSGSDIGGSAYIELTTTNGGIYDEWYVAFRVYVDNSFNGVQKFFQFFDSTHYSYQYAGFGMQSGWLQFDFLDAAAWAAHNHVVSLASIAGAWHHFEAHLIRNNDPDTVNNPNDWPSVKVWHNGVVVTSWASVPTPGSYNSTTQRVYAGTRNQTNKLGVVQVLGLTNGTPNNTTASVVRVQDIAVSTQRIGNL